MMNGYRFSLNRFQTLTAQMNPTIGINSRSRNLRIPPMLRYALKEPRARLVLMMAGPIRRVKKTLSENLYRDLNYHISHQTQTPLIAKTVVVEEFRDFIGLG